MTVRKRRSDEATEGWRAALVLAAALCVSLAAADQETLQRTSRRGPVEAVVRLEPPAPRIGDAVTLHLTVTAEEGVELLMPRFGAALERFQILDFATDETVDAEGRTQATQRYELLPARSGRQTVPPIMIEFVDRRPDATPAPEGLDAYELLTERLAFEVQSVVPDDAEADLHPRLGALPLQVPGAPARWPRVVLLLCILVALPFAWRAWMRWRRRARRRSAYDIAVQRLARLLTMPRGAPVELDAFYVELSAIVRTYLENRFELRAPELTTEEFLAATGGSPDLSAAHQVLLREFLRQADLVKFAHVVPGPADVEASVAAARRFLEETRESTAGREGRGRRGATAGPATEVAGA